MRIMQFRLADADQRRWLFKVFILLLIAALLLSSSWLYYAYKVRQLEYQQGEWPNSFPAKPESDRSGIGK